MLLKQLELLIALNGFKTFSEAAPKLKRSQASISRMVQSLENTFGFQVIERRSDGISFTEKGKTVLKYANLIHNAISGIKNIKYSFLDDIGGEYLLGGFSHTYNLLLVDMLICLQQEYPTLRISLEDRNNADIISNVANRTYLLGLLQLNNIDSVYYQSELLRSNLRSSPGYEEPLCVIAGPCHKLANAGPVTLDQLLSCSTLTSRYQLSEHFELFLRQHGYQERLLVIHDVYTQRKVIGASDCHIGIIPQHGVDTSNQNYHENLLTIPVRDFPLSCRLFWVEHMQGYSKHAEMVVTLIKRSWDKILHKEGLI